MTSNIKKILITGADSYIGTSFEAWAKKRYPGEFEIDTVDMVDGSWREKDFAGYDVVFHVAGIVHQKETAKNKELYYKINRDLAIQTADKAKSSGVKLFILMSSMSVYGRTSGIITNKTKPIPNSNYGKSKLQADNIISRMHSKTFNVAILRPPMIYGEGCKGNYKALSKAVLKIGFFPYVFNERSMLYIENLNFFLKQLIDNPQSGIFFPQNDEYVCVSKMAILIGKAHGKTIKNIPILNTFIKFIPNKTIKKLFGNLIYEKTDLCSYVSFEESIKKTER